MHPRFLAFELGWVGDGSEASPKKVCSTQQLTFEAIGLLGFRTYTFVLYTKIHTPERDSEREREREIGREMFVCPGRTC